MLFKKAMNKIKNTTSDATSGEMSDAFDNGVNNFVEEGEANTKNIYNVKSEDIKENLEDIKDFNNINHVQYEDNTKSIKVGDDIAVNLYNTIKKGKYDGLLVYLKMKERTKDSSRPIEEIMNNDTVSKAQKMQKYSSEQLEVIRGMMESKYYGFSHAKYLGQLQQAKEDLDVLEEQRGQVTDESDSAKLEEEIQQANARIHVLEQDLDKKNEELKNSMEGMSKLQDKLNEKPKEELVYNFKSSEVLSAQEQEILEREARYMEAKRRVVDKYRSSYISTKTKQFAYVPRKVSRANPLELMAMYCENNCGGEEFKYKKKNNNTVVPTPKFTKTVNNSSKDDGKMVNIPSYFKPEVERMSKENPRYKVGNYIKPAV